MVHSGNTLCKQEIRLHGRGGQGTVVATKMLAIAVAKEGNYIQAFPEFGVERRGAPVAAFLRIDTRTIYEKSKIYKPDHIIVLDSTLLKSIDVADGLKDGGWIVINSERSPADLHLDGNYNIATIDATGIAVRRGIGSHTSPIVNTAILGAVVKVLEMCSLDTLYETIMEEAPVKQEQNALAARESYQAVQFPEQRIEIDLMAQTSA